MLVSGEDDKTVLIHCKVKTDNIPAAPTFRGSERSHRVSKWLG